MTKPKAAGKGLSRPQYPREALRLGEEGVVGLNLYITEDGKVAQAQVANTSGSERLDQAAVSHAQRSWKFIPCMQGDKPVACWHQLNFRWKIEDADK
jgi:protein TonB